MWRLAPPPTPLGLLLVLSLARCCKVAASWWQCPAGCHANSLCIYACAAYYTPFGWSCVWRGLLCMPHCALSWCCIIVACCTVLDAYVSICVCGCSAHATRCVLQPDVASLWCVAYVCGLFSVSAAVHATQCVCFYLVWLAILGLGICLVFVWPCSRVACVWPGTGLGLVMATRACVSLGAVAPEASARVCLLAFGV